MSKPEFCSIEDINDELGLANIEGLDGLSMVDDQGIVKENRVTRLIQRSSEIINNEHKSNVNRTLYEDEYHDSHGLPFIMLKHAPILEIESLEEYSGTNTWEVLVEGRNQSVDDFYIKDNETGLIGFWSTPSAGEQTIRVSYYAGHYDPDEHEEPPIWARHACIMMVCIAIASSKQFQEENKDQINKWKEYIFRKTSDLRSTFEDYITRHEISAFSLGKYNDILTNVWESYYL
jgi:hypothetical protein